jgi:hypothetical protein
MGQSKTLELKQRFANKRRAIVVGNGPSISDVDWDKIQASKEREDTLFLACNRISILFDRTTWRPDIYSCLTSASLAERRWQESIDKCLKEERITSIVFNNYSRNTKLKKIHDNVIFANKVTEHSRHDPIRENFIDIPLDNGIVKSYSATTTLFQICNFLDIKTLGVIGQDGYIFEAGKNHFDDAYGFESSSFNKTNTRILALHKELKRFFGEKGVKVYNLSDKSILKDLYPNKNIFDFMSS